MNYQIKNNRTAFLAAACILLLLLSGFLIFMLTHSSSSPLHNSSDALMAEGDPTETEAHDKLLVPYTEALELLHEGAIAEVTDVETGVTYFVKRIGGLNHADVETLTAEDTEKLKSTYDGEWSWKRRAVIVNVDGVEIAGSMAAMPHSGREDAPFGAMVDNRSGGSGKGINLNSIRDNNMNGVVDIYFYNSLVPGLNRIDERHQFMVKQAASSRNE